MCGSDFLGGLAARVKLKASFDQAGRRCSTCTARWARSGSSPGPGSSPPAPPSACIPPAWPLTAGRHATITAEEREYIEESILAGQTAEVNPPVPWLDIARCPAFYGGACALHCSDDAWQASSPWASAPTGASTRCSPTCRPSSTTSCACPSPTHACRRAVPSLTSLQGGVVASVPYMAQFLVDARAAAPPLMLGR